MRLHLLIYVLDFTPFLNFKCRMPFRLALPVPEPFEFTTDDAHSVLCALLQPFLHLRLRTPP